jgi:RHS repeat-associated protein
MTSINGFTPLYDPDGNVLNDNSHTYSWDIYGRPVTIDSVNLTYDALGRMVEQNRSGAYTQFVYAPTGQKMQIMNGQASTKSIVALPGGGQAVFTASGQYYYHSDHLGSFRFASSSTRAMYFDLAHAPFGDIYASSGSTDPAFTGQRADTVAGLYDFPAREYSFQGRWASPDPAGLAAVNPANPQSWNRYAYVMNNPLALIDPQGLSDCPDLKFECGDISGDLNGAPGVDLFGGLNFGTGNPANGCDMGDITNCAAQQSNREIASDIASENIAGFTALNALQAASADFIQSIDEENMRLSQPPGGRASETIIVHCSGVGIDSWECSPWGPYAQFLAAGWQPALVGDEARLRYLARGVVKFGQGPINVMSVAFVAETGGILGIEAAPVLVNIGPQVVQGANEAVAPYWDSTLGRFVLRSAYRGQFAAPPVISSAWSWIKSHW